ncbi:uncharacterized protein LOC130647679 [Hydractinia symbiolongicarpus]|uniref:uncharacterized protein LOC130647679 n=1 Tax=Hydractinia symbiolongicarpus TaxID=13093 RepID=UPI00254ED3CA|nr:uncharacterized protein LOC130647679 [Hydractinia symbiolongicarpus]XP_057309600.1 uncharacterized protein LOC130647679 [Hydractinia symbiolongicarpus]
MAVCIRTEEKEHQYAQPWDDSDVILIVENDKFHVHSNILGFASSVFKTMLSSEFKEGKEKVINFPGKSKVSVLILLNLIYPFDFTITDFSCCESLLELAREYDIKGIMLLVDDFLTFQVKCSFDILKMADSFDLTKTLKKHVEYYGETKYTKKDTFSNFVFANQDWGEISQKTRLHILYKKTKKFNYGKYVKLHCDSKLCDHVLPVSPHEVVSLVEAIEAFGKMYESA